MFLNLNSQFCKRDVLEKECRYPIENKEEIFKKVDTFLYLMSTADSGISRWIDEEDRTLWVEPFDRISYHLSKKKWNAPRIVGIMDEYPNLYSVKVMFDNNSDSTNLSLIGIYTLFLKYDSTNRSYKFKDYRTIHIEKNYDTIKVGNITYYSKNTNKLNKVKCTSFNEFNTQIARIFKTKPKEISYFHLKNTTELLNIFGWDIIYNMFYAPTGGFAGIGGKGTRFENQIYSGNNSERYDHELIHLYYNELLYSDTSKSTLIIAEGIPTYFGGSSGLTYKELKRNLKQYLDKTDSVKIENHYKDRSVNIQINKTTNYIYSMGAFIAELFYIKNGYEGLKELANLTNENFIKKIAEHFNVKEEDLDKYLRNAIKSL